jgi:hypothetical protein
MKNLPFSSPGASRLNALKNLCKRFYGPLSDTIFNPFFVSIQHKAHFYLNQMTPSSIRGGNLFKTSGGAESPSEVDVQ